MKEVTYEDWQKNPIPRTMWVWDFDESARQQRKVIYFLDPKVTYLVVALAEDGISIEHFRCCAEIKKQRRMTNKELARWLREKPTREFKYNHCDDNCINSYLYYYESNADKEVDESVVIREDDGEWREPLVEVEE